MLGGDVVTGHDLKTGEELWRMTGFNPTNDAAYRTIASAVYHDGIMFAPTRERPLQAFKIGGHGDITKSNLLWQFNNGPDVPTPVVDGKDLFRSTIAASCGVWMPRPARRSTAASG